ncbi:MAG: YdcF family protein [Acidobacteriota bacterium]|nr:YdcF family protein [Acidobacteriota bacterium]
MKTSRSFKLIAAFSLAFLAWVLLAPFLAERLIVEKPLARADAILVLSGSSVYLERTEKAAELYKQGIAPRVFLTDDGERAGWSRSARENPLFVELERKSLTEQGVPAEAIEVLPERVDGTKSEAEAMKKKVEESNFKSVLLVTSSYHTRRALRTFEKTFADDNQGVEIGIESAPTGKQTPLSSMWWFSPKGWKFVAGEYVKSLYYWVYY